MKALLIVIALLCPASAWAGPITASHTGCVNDFSNASKTATWESSRHFRWVVLWQDDAGCGATDGRAIGLNGVFERIVWADGSEHVTVNQSLLPTCGRGQMDAQDTGEFTDEMLEILAVVFNTGIDCVRTSESIRRLAFVGDPIVTETLVYSNEPPILINDPPVNDPPTPTPTITPFGQPVRDSGSTLVLMLLALTLALTLRRRR